MSGHPERFIHLATAASDGRSVDWKREADLCADERDRRLVRALGFLASVLEANRSLHGGPGRAAAPPGPLDTGRHWGSLEILDEIGRGSFATVYRARDPRLDREVALKAWPADPGSADAVLTEGRLMAKVRHPNVATVYGAGVHAGRVGLWMELVEGTSLADHLREHGPLGPGEAISVGLELCAALAAVHAAGVVHGDLKAQNVVRERGGRLVLTDFGSGQDLVRTPSVAGSNASGTPLFMAPEVLAGGPKTVRSDLYSLGVLLYHLLTGRYPQEAATVEELRAAHARRAPRPLRDLRPDLPAGIVETVTRVLSSEPAARFESAGDLERALVASLGVSHARRIRTPGRRPIVLGAALGGVGLALILAAVAWRSERAAGVAVGDSAIPPASLAASVKTALYRVGAAGDQALAGGETLRPGDRLYLEVRAEVPVSVYVVNLDREGRGYLLFPVAGAQWSNPLASGSTYRLPGSADWQSDSWEVSSAGGQESIIVVASRQRLERLEASLASLQAVSGAGPAPPAGGVDDALRGVGRLADSARASGTGASAVTATLRDLVSASAGRDDLLVREYVFENP